MPIPNQSLRLVHKQKVNRFRYTYHHPTMTLHQVLLKVIWMLMIWLPKKQLLKIWAWRRKKGRSLPLSITVLPATLDFCRTNSPSISQMFPLQPSGHQLMFFWSNCWELLGFFICLIDTLLLQSFPKKKTEWSWAFPKSIPRWCSSGNGSDAMRWRLDTNSFVSRFTLDNLR